jgi:uncharacterized protein (DUF1778 family)
MTSDVRDDTQINLLITTEQAQLVADAASALGQTVEEFAISVIERETKQVLHDAQITRLSNRDRDAFLDALDSIVAKPNRALKTAARRYKKLGG